VAQRVSEGGRMTRKRLDVVHDKGQMRKIGSYLDRSAGIILADLDKLVAFRRFKENQLRAAAAGAAPDLFQPKHLLVEVNGLIEVRDAVARVIQSLNHRPTLNAKAYVVSMQKSSISGSRLTMADRCWARNSVGDDWPGFDLEILRCEHVIRPALGS